MMSSFLKLYGITLGTCLILDLTWIGILAKNFYQEKLNYLLNDSFNLSVGFIFYVLFSLALIIFVIWPAQEKNSLLHALLFGFFFGLVTYSAYDLTNQATIKNWPIIVTVIDMLWGATLAGCTSSISFFLANKLNIR